MKTVAVKELPILFSGPMVRALDSDDQMKLLGFAKALYNVGRPANSCLTLNDYEQVIGAVRCLSYSENDPRHLMSAVVNHLYSGGAHDSETVFHLIEEVKQVTLPEGSARNEA